MENSVPPVVWVISDHNTSNDSGRKLSVAQGGREGSLSSTAEDAKWFDVKVFSSSVVP